MQTCTSLHLVPVLQILLHVSDLKFVVESANQFSLQITVHAERTSRNAFKNLLLQQPLHHALV